MSTAPAGIPSNPSQRTSHPSGTLAVLAATAIGGVLATRLGKAPLVLAAGAAAYALLKQKRPTVPMAPPLPLPPPPPPPTPPQEIPAQSQIEQWLSRQLTREAQTPLIDLSSSTTATHEPEDDYHPQSLLLDDAEEAALFPPAQDSFATLTEPVPQQTPAPIEHWSATSAPFAPAAIPPQALAETTDTDIPPAVADAAWTLGVEPLPSLNETTVPAPSASLASSMFFSAPMQQEELEQSHAFSLPVFEGAAFPDEINVAPPDEPPAVKPVVPVKPVVHLTPTLAMYLPSAPENEPPPAVATAPEIPVQLAALAEASFDPQLAAITHHPWETASAPPALKLTAPPPSHTSRPVVDAEVILRPRAPMQNSVNAKLKFSPPGLIKQDTAESFDSPSAVTPDAASADTPQPPTRAPRSWRSWWRDD